MRSGQRNELRTWHACRWTKSKGEGSRRPTRRRRPDELSIRVRPAVRWVDSRTWGAAMLIATMKEAQAFVTAVKMADVRWMPERHSAQRTQLTEWPRSPHLELATAAAAVGKWVTVGGTQRDLRWRFDVPGGHARADQERGRAVAGALQEVAGGGEQEGRPAGCGACWHKEEAKRQAKLQDEVIALLKEELAAAKAQAKLAASQPADRAHSSRSPPRRGSRTTCRRPGGGSWIGSSRKS